MSVEQNKEIALSLMILLWTRSAWNWVCGSRTKMARTPPNLRGRTASVASRC
jgi:hypothetical protein